MAKSILYADSYRINDFVSLKVPTVGDIIKDEDSYFECISLIVSTPYDMMVQLDDIGIDFTQITDWDLFCLLFEGLKSKDLSLIFTDLELKDFDLAINKQNNNTVLWNEKTGAVIDMAIHDQISTFLRKLLYLEKNDKRPANEEARRFMIDRARHKMKRRQKKKSTESQLETYIVALVNTPEFHYDYKSVLDLTIYQFYASLHQIIKKIKFDKLMIGCYAGTVNTKEIDKDELSWISI